MTTMDNAASTPATDDAAPLLTIDGHWDFDYTYYAGAAASRFFAELRNGRIMGSLCPECGRTLVPARKFCDACYVDTTQWREVGLAGVLETFTILTHALPGSPEPPFVVGYVTLDGASTALLNYVEGVDLSDLDAAGMALLNKPRVRVLFADEPKGRITDFRFALGDLP
jgi:uncharacterized protein